MSFAEDEFPINRLFEPCQDWTSTDGYCLNTSRSILYVRSNGGKQLICGNGHAMLHNGKPFIPAYEFADGGAFAGVLPPEQMPKGSTIKGSRWKPSRQSIARLSEFTSCARCGAAEFNSYENKDTTKLWTWLNEFAPDLVSAVHLELRAKPGAELKDWFQHISVALRTRIVKRADDSILNIDHGVPRKVGDRLWPLLSTDERLFLQETLLFMMCRMCNGSKSSKLLPNDELTRIYAETLYGSIAAAKQDSIRWELFQAVLEKAYQQRAYG